MIGLPVLCNSCNTAKYAENIFSRNPLLSWEEKIRLGGLGRASVLWSGGQRPLTPDNSDVTGSFRKGQILAKAPELLRVPNFLFGKIFST